jgi:uncharacterized protein with PIN domain
VIDISSMMAMAGSLKTAGELLKGLADIKEAAAVQAKIVELTNVIMTAQSHALSAQNAQLGLLEINRELEARLAQIEGWEAEKLRYELRDFGNQTFAYVLKPDLSNGEPLHYLCANCFPRGVKSILQRRHSASGRNFFKCKGCETEQELGGNGGAGGARNYVARGDFNVF